MLMLQLTGLMGCHTANVREQVATINSELSDLRETNEAQRNRIDQQEKQLAAVLPVLKNEVHYRDGWGRYSLFRGKARNTQDEIIYVIENTTKRMVAFQYDDDTMKLKVIAGRKLAPDLGFKTDSHSNADAKDVKVQRTSYMVVKASVDADVIVALDDEKHKLLVYELDFRRKRIEMAASVSLNKVFRIAHPDVDDPLGPRER